jgi:hypothetical protein
MKKMKKKLLHSFIISTLIIVGLNNSAYAQLPTLDWVKSIGGSVDNDMGNSIKVDGSGNVYTTGFFSGTVDFDPSSGITNITSTAYSNVFITKFDNSGNFIWVKTIGGINYCSGSSLTIDNSGNIYITGFFEGTADFNPGSGINNLTGTGSTFVLKLNSAGDFVWAKNVDINGYALVDVTIDLNYNVIITGRHSGSSDFDPGSGTFNLTSSGLIDIFILKLDVLGNFVWAKSIGSSNIDSGQSLDTDNNGNVYITGLFSSTADFDPGVGTFNLTSSGITDIFILKLDASGNLNWVKQFGNTGNDMGSSIVLDATGDVYITGDFEGSVDFSSGMGSGGSITSIGNSDAFILKLNSSGNFIWVKQFGGTAYQLGKSITIDDTGDIYATGEFNGTVDFDPNLGTYNLSTNAGQDVYIIKIASSGNFVWAKNFGNSLGSYLNSIAVGLDGSVYTTGSYQGTMDFDPSSNVYNLTSSGSYDIFIHKLDMVAPEEYCDFTYSINAMVVNFSSSNPNCTNFIWDFGNGNTSTINPDPIVTYATAGSYSPCFKCNIPVSCLSCLTITVPGNGSGGTTGIENTQKEQGITIYPNPSSDIITIETENHNLNSSYVILNSIGQKVLSGQLIANKNKIDIRHLSIGFYLIQIGETERHSFKLMKN